MKHIKKNIAIMLILCFLIMGMPVNAQETTTITSEEAVDLGLLFYYANIPEDKNFVVTAYHITPLYSDSGSILYYCIDFIVGDTNRGYAVIAADTSYELCTELSYDGISEYYQNEQDEFENIYFSPFDKFYSSKETKRSEKSYYNSKGEKIKKSKVKGRIAKGDKSYNRKLKKEINEDGAVPSNNMADGDLGTQSPTEFLTSKGFTNISCSSYSTIETGMANAEAMNVMFNASNSDIETENGHELPGGTFLKNPNHCAITAMTNLLLYWRLHGAPAYPSDYETLFERVLLTANDKEGYIYIREDGGGFNRDYYPEVLLAVNAYYNYDGRVIFTEDGYWDFLVTYVKDYDWPIILSFKDSEFPINNHATVAFGYTIMQCKKNSTSYNFKFIKLADGHNATGVYVNWNIMVEFDVPTKMTTFCPYK